MTPEQKRLIKETWRRVLPIADGAAALFYNRLFEIDPSTEALFRKTNMPDQRKKLVQTLTVALQGLDNLDALVPVVESLGRRHRGYGVTAEHYESVGAALLWTLEQGLGKAWTPEAAAAWMQLYGLLSAIMRRAANEPAQTTPKAA
jgi:hemoglobin-like flavoprotein